jgi:hypothetical protein
VKRYRIAVVVTDPYTVSTAQGIVEVVEASFEAHCYRIVPGTLYVEEIPEPDHTVQWATDGLRTLRIT